MNAQRSLQSFWLLAATVLLIAMSPAQHEVDLVTESETVSIAAGTPPGWVRFPVSAVSVDDQYIIMIDSGSLAGVIRITATARPPTGSAFRTAVSLAQPISSTRSVITR